MGVVFALAAVNYTGAAGMATAKVTGGGNNALTLTPTISAAYEPTAAVVVAGGAGYGVGDIVNLLNDATGAGAQYTVSAVNAGVVTAVTYVPGSAIATAIDATKFFTGQNGVVGNPRVDVAKKPMRNVPADSYIRRSQAVGLNPALGELPIDFAEVERNWLIQSTNTAFDLTDGTIMQVSLPVGNVVKPSITGYMDWDGFPNTRTVNGQTSRVSNPIKWSEIPVALAAGDTPLNDTNFAIGNEPIQRMWFLGANAGNITKLYVEVDGDIKMNLPVSQINQRYQRYGFQFGRPNYVNQNIAGSNIIKAALSPISYFDAAILPDFDQRFDRRLVFGSNLKVTVTSAVAQQCRVLIETAPGGWQ